MSDTAEAGTIAIGSGTVPPSAGGKAVGLAEIVRVGLPVPAAWAVLPGVTNRGLSALLETLSARGIERVAVRSSAAGEDGARYSFAGIHETELGVPIARIRAAIAHVAASPLAPRAQAYRRQHGLDPASGPCAVVVQEMVDAEWAGVAFGKGDGVLVEAVEGLGDAAVNGDAMPEQIEVLREGAELRVSRRWPRKQPFALRATAAGVERIALDGERPALPEQVALAVAAGVRSLEEAQRRPLDVEWAARDGRVVFLQARPQTHPLEQTLAAGEIWTRTNVSDTFPEIASACARSYMVPALDRLMHTVYARFGAPVSDRVPLAAEVAGRLVFNERAVYGFGDLVGVPRAWMKVVMGGAGGVSNAYVQGSVWTLLRRIGLVIRVGRFARGAEDDARAYIQKLREEVARTTSTPAERELTPESFREQQRRTSQVMDEGALITVQVACALQHVLSSAAMVLRKHPAPAALLSRLLDPDLVSVSTRQMEEQVEIALAMRRWVGGRRFLDEVTAAHAEGESWQRSMPPDLWARVQGWVASYGHRGRYESDPAQPRYGDDLRLLATALRALVTSAEEPEPLEARRARRRADCDAAWREVSGTVGAVGRRSLLGAVRRLGRLTVVREELRSTMVRWGALARRQMLDAGRSLVVTRRLEGPEDIFLLSLEELERALLDPAFDTRAAVARERARVAAWRRVDVPDHFRSEEVASFGRVGATTAGTDRRLLGTAVSPGVVEARVCLLRSPDDEAKMSVGGILVAPTTDPGWTHLFARAAGVVVEIGGVLSHAATVAREYGLPCVSNVDDALTRLRDGDLVRVDGTHGAVEILERAGPDGVRGSECVQR
jgi:pyruvate,water dikinase